jgi:predicted amidohydrolase
VKIGFIQTNPILGQTDQNLTRIAALVRQADSAELLVLPELCHCGYRFESRQQTWDLSETIGDSRTISFLHALCRERGLHLVAGFNEREGDKLYNTAVLVGPGGLVGKYRKMHLFLDEKDIFEPGNVGLPVFDIGSCKVGMLVCFDWMFPEVWRILSLKGADIICHPSNLVIPGLCQKAVPVHAVCNRVFVVTANRIGTERDLTFTGLSTIADPKANVLLQASSDHEVVGLVEIDPTLARNKQATSRNNIFDDRRPGEYRELL